MIWRKKRPASHAGGPDISCSPKRSEETQELHPWARGPGRRLAGALPEVISILYVRSPTAFLDDSMFSAPMLPRMLANRTVCGCQYLS
jgi:hypothetical protein